MFRHGFTLIELLVALAILLVLLALLLPMVSKVQRSSRSTACLNQLRQIGSATLMYAQDNRDRFPRSSHSALAYNAAPWGYALSPYVGAGTYTGPGPDWDRLFNGLYRCPEDNRRDAWSYGKSVWFELSAGETGEIDGRAVGPTYWTYSSVPRPGVTVLYGELGSGAMADHLMAHFWLMGGSPEVDAERHGSASNYVFVDGHAEALEFAATFDPPAIDRWHPGRAQ
jgi:general secretion pathway protein G